MKLSNASKKNLPLSLCSKFLVFFLVALQPVVAVADRPDTPQGSFTMVEDEQTLRLIGLHGTPVWCYDVEANSVIITAPATERARCELRLMYELEKQQSKHKLEIDKLNLRVETLQQQHNEINQIKDTEIEKLTQAALKRPNDNNVWWGIGGFSVGVSVTLVIGWLFIGGGI